MADDEAKAGPPAKATDDRVDDTADVNDEHKETKEDSGGKAVKNGHKDDSNNDNDEEELEPESGPFLRDLRILPPLQQIEKVDSNGGTIAPNFSTVAATFKGSVALPPIRPEEPVSSLRAALGEVRGYAHITSFRLVLDKDWVAPSSTTNAAVASSSEDSSHLNSDSIPSDVQQSLHQQSSAKGKKNKKKRGKGGSSSKSATAGPSFISTSDVVSPYTGRNAVVCIPAPVQSLAQDPTETILKVEKEVRAEQLGADKDDSKDGDEQAKTVVSAEADSSNPAPENGTTTNNNIINSTEVVLDDYGDLAPLLEHGLGSGSAFRMVLERYDAAAVRDHVTRLRSLFDGNAPSVDTLAEDGDSTSGKTKSDSVNDKENDENDSNPKNIDDNGEGDVKESKVLEETSKTENDNSAIDGESPNDKGKKENDEDKSNAAEETDGERQRRLRESARKSHLSALSEKMPSFPLDRPITLDGTNLADFYYLACGEEEALDAAHGIKKRKATAENEDLRGEGRELGDSTNLTDVNANANNNEGSDEREEAEREARELAGRLQEVDLRTRVRCNILFGGFHPPPPHRRILGDLAYLEVSIEGNSSPPSQSGSNAVIHVTASPTGFYVNKTSPAQPGSPVPFIFDPTPAEDSCFSHTLLDCLLLKSKVLRSAWADAMVAAKERAEMSSSNDTPLQAMFRVAVRGDAPGGDATSSQSIDSLVIRPTWLVPLPRAGGKNGNNGTLAVRSSWNHDKMHEYNPARSEEDLTSTFGLDIRGGAARDWNEELQGAREMPTDTLQDRVERARLIHKVLSDFGAAALAGVRAIVDGFVASMNPNEQTRSHVYLHNNIFFSRAVDAGVDTFKISQGDRAAKKTASRDAQCMGALHRLDIAGLHTLATVLVDYLGTRFVCQSIVPGIMHGERTHKLLYGAVEPTTELAWDKDMHELLEQGLGKGLMVATRKVPKSPLTDERIEVIKRLRTTPLNQPRKEDEDEGEEEKESAEKQTVTPICGPVEIKGIRGSDQRKYVLDLTRLTPRDANWIPKSEGGTGHWEDDYSGLSNEKGKPSPSKYIPETLDDDEWTTAVLRPELVSSYAHKKMGEWLESKDKKPKEATQEDVPKDQDETKSKEKFSEKSSLENKTKPSDPEDEERLEELRMNVNVFLPHTKSLMGLDDDSFKQFQADEDRAREIANQIWENILPSLTKEIRENAGHQIPVDGESLTDLLHQRGINCRYLGRLASLAQEEEAKDRSAKEAVDESKADRLPRRTMPICWLEMLECEMVARAAKHVLDAYLTENGGAAAMQPAQTIASFFSALLSTGEESAAETELRTKNNIETLDEEETNALTIHGTGGCGDAVPMSIRGRNEMWEDVHQEIGRRFRYTLTLYDKFQSGASASKPEETDRALYIPLLRRLCQRTGVRLIGKNYSLGAKCICSGGNNSGGRTTASYPIGPTDILDILPLVKHSGSLPGEGFVACSFGVTAATQSLHILLPDAKANFESAHIHWNARALPLALDAVQEAASLYQRVVDTPLHANVARCLDLTAVILFQAQEPELAAANAGRALAVAVQLGGFDCAETVNAHSTLSHILISSGGLAAGIKHLRASLYLTEVMTGPHYSEISSMYHKLGTMYHEVGSLINALRFYREATTRKTSDRMVEGMIDKSIALVLAGLGQFKAAHDTEKRAYGLYRQIFGDSHDLTKKSAHTRKQFMTLAVEQGTRWRQEEEKRREEQAADAAASEIEAEEEGEDEEKKKKKKKAKKKRKN